MQTRKPVVAGQFYPAQHDACVDEIHQYLDRIALPESLPEAIVAGIVPHAGWTFSGLLAAMVFAAVKQQHEKVHTFILFGAAHGYFGSTSAIYHSGAFATPLGSAVIDEDLADAVLNTRLVRSDASAHQLEHSIEVQIPFIQYLFAGARILPIIVPPTEQAIELGTETAGIISAQKDKKIVCIGSTDLTHYGPRYGFTPMGKGPQALKWAREINDTKFIDLALKLQARELLRNAAENQNACGPGAAAAAVAAAKKLGKTKGVLLNHTDSNEVMMQKMGTKSSESVGYAAIIY